MNGLGWGSLLSYLDMLNSTRTRIPAQKEEEEEEESVLPVPCV